MKPIYVADSETDPFKAGRIPAPFIWGLYNGETYTEFNSTDEFVDYVTQIDCIVYAHNGGKFDWHFILDKLEQFQPLMVIAGRLSKFKIGKAEFRDSINILPMPLSAWEKDEFDYTILEKEVRNLPENKIKISKYLKNDCIYLYEMVTEYIDRYGLNLTQAGTAMKVWQKICKVKAPKTTAYFYECIAPFYYGGRVECFKTGVIRPPKGFKVIDINSAYPWSMKHYHPYGEYFDTFDELPETREEIERCFITLECVSYGALPSRDKNGLSFPNDENIKEFFITGWEYIAGLDTKTIKNITIKSVIIFPETIIFDDYIDHFYKMKTDAKKNNDKAGYIFSKLFLNSLYGKFSACPSKYREYTIVKPRFIEAAEDEGYGYCAELGPWALVDKPIDPDRERFYNVAVGASITGFVRAYMMRSMNKCEGVIYCDTDSIVCESTGDLVIDPTTLGAWDVEAECDFGGVGGKKLYAFHTLDDKWKTASKGVRLNHDEIMKVAQGQVVTYNPENPSFSLKRGVKFISRKVSKTFV